MNKTIVEDWSFELEVLSAGACRIGLETDDAFGCTTAAGRLLPPKPWELYAPCARRPALGGIFGC